ncbi:MAG: radical SAM protein [Actinomycetota bacterium]
MTKIMLINPPWYILQGSSLSEIPIGLSYLASFLKEKGRQVEVFNADFGSPKYVGYKSLYESYSAYLACLNNLEDNIWQGIIKEVEEYKPDIVGLTLKTGAYKSACNIACLIKRYFPRVIIVAGGPHATILPQETAQEGCFDYVVKGEGEITFLELIERIEKDESLEEVKGLTYFKNGKIIDNPARHFIEELDNLPFLERDSHLHRKQYSPDTISLIITGRGCPYACTFCASEKIWKRKVRFRSPFNIVDEINIVYKKYGSRHFKFRDDTFTLNKQRALEICELLIRQKLPITWQCETRADCLDEELVRKMKEAGCIGVSIGVESGSERILKYIEKGETKEKIAEGIKLLRKFGINVSTFMMIGFPTETEEEMEETMKFVKKLSPNHIILSILTPYPGTKIYDDSLRLGLLKDDSFWEGWFHQSPEMGIAENKERFRKLAQRYLREIETYNTSIWRKIIKLSSQMLRNRYIIVRKVRKIWKKR